MLYSNTIECYELTVLISTMRLGVHLSAGVASKIFVM